MDGRRSREVVSYLRVSTEIQGLNGFGIAAQRDAVIRFVAAYSCVMVAEYAEVETGRKDHLKNRPQLMKAVAHAKRSGALLVIARFDRLARSVLVTSQLLASGVEFVACDNPHANRLTIHILAAMAEYEGRIISERTKAGLAAARARGVNCGGAGINLTPEARAKGQQAAKLAHVVRAREAYADLVPLVKELRENGGSMRTIAAHLNEMGHRNQRRNRWSIANVRALFIREGMAHLTNILGPNRNITPSIQKMGCEAAGVYSRAQAKAAYAHIAPYVLERYRAGVSLGNIAEALNEQGFRTQRWGKFWVPTIRGILTREGVPKPAAGRWTPTPKQHADMVAAATAAKRKRSEEFRAIHLPFAVQLRAEGKTFKQIAAKFNHDGRRTSRGLKWTWNNVWVLVNVDWNVSSVRRSMEKDRKRLASGIIG